MAERKRLRRTEPIRREPIRNGTAYLRDSHSGGSGTEDADGSQSDRGRAAESLEDVVTQGVQLGYQVIEAYLRQGQRVAERLSNASNGAGDKKSSKGKEDGAGIESNVDELMERMRCSYKGLGGDMEDLMERTMHFYKDMWELGMEGVELFFRSPMFMTGLARAEGSRQAAPSMDTQSESGGAANGFGVTPVVEIMSSRPARVALKMNPQAGQFSPRVHALHAADLTIRPLTGVSFQLDPELAIPIVQVRIPDDQPSGTYTGAVVDRDTNEPKGTLCISILS